jgi:hypothetical protein
MKPFPGEKKSASPPVTNGYRTQSAHPSTIQALDAVVNLRLRLLPVQTRHERSEHPRGLSSLTPSPLLPHARACFPRLARSLARPVPVQLSRVPRSRARRPRSSNQPAVAAAPLCPGNCPPVSISRRASGPFRRV